MKAGERRTADAIRLAVPDLHGRRADQDRRRQGASDAEARGAAVPVLLACTEPGDVVLDPFFGDGDDRRGGETAWPPLDRHRARGEICGGRREAHRRLLPLSGGAMAISQGKRGEARVAFGALVETGMVRPGTRLTCHARRHVAHVRADGSLAMDGKPVRFTRWVPPRRACRAATAGPSGTMRRRALVAIDAKRSAYRAASGGS